MLVQGDIIGNLEVLESLDAGSLTWAFKVRHRETGLFYTLKVLAVDDEEARARFVQEGRSMARFAHPNLTTALGMVDTPQGPGIVEAYVRGMALDTWLNDGPHPLEARLDVFRGICEGVAEAHRHGIIHRNLQPANVSITTGPDGWVPVLMDFTLAKHTLDEAAWTTGIGTLMGTLGYMAPEQHEAANTVDARADVFSLGCLLYLLATGEEPFQEEEDMNLLWTLMHARPPHPHTIAPDLPDSLVKAIDRATRRDLAERTPSVEALLAMLPR